MMDKQKESTSLVISKHNEVKNEINNASEENKDMDKGQNSNKNEIINRIQPHKAEKAKNDSDDLKGANTKQNINTNEENSTDFDEKGKFLIYNGNNNNNIKKKILKVFTILRVN